MRSPFRHEDFPVERLLRDKRGVRTSVCLLAKESAPTIETVVTAMTGLREAGVVEQILVVDAGSRDGTAAIAASAGADVVQEAELRADLGPVLGKGDAMWRALALVEGEIVCFLDTDDGAFGPHVPRGLIGPLFARPELAFVKAAYERPYSFGGASLTGDGGRVSQLTARPLLTMFYPELAALRQPLSGDVAARRDLLERIPFTTGYAVETAMLIDVLHEAGPGAIAEVDLGERRNRHQSLRALTPMAWAVLRAVVVRLEREGRLRDVAPGRLMVPHGSEVVATDVELIERPPYRM